MAVKLKMHSGFSRPRKIGENPMLAKSFWEGNKWPCVEIFPYEYDDFIKTIIRLSMVLKFEPPEITDILDGYAAEFKVDGFDAKALMDNWTFSIAAENERIRDRIYDALSQ